MARAPGPSVQVSALLLLVIAGTLIYVDRAALSIANPLIREELGLSIADMGLLLSAFLWAYAFSQLPGGALTDRLGPRHLLDPDPRPQQLGDRATPRYCVNWLGSARTISGFPCTRHREALERRSFASTSSAICCMPGAPFTRTNHLELEIGFGDPEYLAASLFAFSATFEICRDDTICRQGSCQNSGRRRDSLTMNTI
jgi:MFS family permease